MTNQNHEEILKDSDDLITTFLKKYNVSIITDPNDPDKYIVIEN